MLIVTGGAGFIGSNLVRGLNERGFSDILVVDDLTDGRKCLNLSRTKIRDFLDKDDFLCHIERGHGFGTIEAVFHQGACSATTEWNAKLLMKTNYEYSKTILRWSIEERLPFYYASSASVYGRGPNYTENTNNEHPLNAYAYSKFLFDEHVRSNIRQIKTPVVGLRYFNVYGPHEHHKDSMASVALHFKRQLKESNVIKLFEGSDGFGPGQQMRDFVYVEDVVAVNLWMLENSSVSGIYNCGTGIARSFNDFAKAVLNHYKSGSIEYMRFPPSLLGRYQSYTQANIESLRNVGFSKPFINIEDGISRYLTWLDENDI